MTYGPRQSISNPYTGVMSIFSTQILNDKPPVIFEDGNQIRDMVFVEDVAKANLFVAENDEIVNDYFNVGTGKKTKIIDLANMLISAYKKNFRPNISGEFRPGEVRHLFADCSKLEKYGFKSETLLKDGILSYLNWINEQDNVKEYFSNAIDQLKKLRVVVSTK